MVWSYWETWWVVLQFYSTECFLAYCRYISFLLQGFALVTWLKAMNTTPLHSVTQSCHLPALFAKMSLLWLDFRFRAENWHVNECVSASTWVIGQSYNLWSVHELDVALILIGAHVSCLALWYWPKSSYGSGDFNSPVSAKYFLSIWGTLVV